jgi:hypothetical protein
MIQETIIDSFENTIELIYKEKKLFPYIINLIIKNSETHFYRFQEIL